MNRTLHKYPLYKKLDHHYDHCSYCVMQRNVWSSLLHGHSVPTELLETLSNSRRRPGGCPPSAPQPGSRSTSFGGKNKTKQTCRRRVNEAIFLLSLPLSPVRMASLRNTREALLLGYSEGWLDEMEFLALYDLNTSENLEFPYDSYDQFNLDDIDEAECIAEFRFEKRHILQLEEVLQIPALLKCDQRSVFTGTEGLCLLLKRLAYPCRYSDLIYRFGRPVSSSNFVNHYQKDIFDFKKSSETLKCDCASTACSTKGKKSE